MYEPILRAAAVFCCLGMGAWPLMQRCGGCFASAVEIAERIDREQCRTFAPAAEPYRPADLRVFEAVPSFAIKNFTEDLSMVESVFTSAFQVTHPGDQTVWEIVQHLPPARLPKHVLFCTMLD
jgi:hypothetical protein